MKQSINDNYQDKMDQQDIGLVLCRELKRSPFSELYEIIKKLLACENLDGIFQEQVIPLLWKLAFEWKNDTQSQDVLKLIVAYIRVDVENTFDAMENGSSEKVIEFLHLMEHDDLSVQWKQDQLAEVIRLLSYIIFVDMNRVSTLTKCYQQLVSLSRNHSLKKEVHVQIATAMQYSLLETSNPDRLFLVRAFVPLMIEYMKDSLNPSAQCQAIYAFNNTVTGEENQLAYPVFLENSLASVLLSCMDDRVHDTEVISDSVVAIGAWIFKQSPECIQLFTPLFFELITRIVTGHEDMAYDALYCLYHCSLNQEWCSIIVANLVHIEPLFDRIDSFIKEEKADELSLLASILVHILTNQQSDHLLSPDRKSRLFQAIALLSEVEILDEDVKLELESLKG